jgi:hypothetical protein
VVGKNLTNRSVIICFEIVFIDMGGALVSQYDYGEPDFVANRFCITRGSLSSKCSGVFCVSLFPVPYLTTDEWLMQWQRRKRHWNALSQILTLLDTGNIAVTYGHCALCLQYVSCEI